MGSEQTRTTLDYQNVIVKKPWGQEYLMFSNGVVAIWCLQIQEGAKTSLHCHPVKKTGLILLSGEAVVSFLGDSRCLKALSKLTIRPGLFHSTEAISPGGVTVLEVESPCDKTNLVRFRDAYGRENESYEGSEATVPMDPSCVQLDCPQEGLRATYALCGYDLLVEKISEIERLRNRDAGEVIVVLEGGLYSHSGEPVLSVGDVVSSGTLDQLAQAFLLMGPMGLVVIRHKP